LLEGGNNQLLSEKDFVAKIIAANEAKIEPDFMIIARIEALIAGIGMKEALKRAYAYEKAGADLILIHSKQITPEEIFEFADSWKGTAPLVVIPTTYYSVNVDELIEHKIKMVIYANQTLRTAHFALSKLLKQMASADNMSQFQNQMSSMDDIFKLQEMYDVKSQEKSIEEKLRKLGYIS
jgi:phosphoenolpyruvate phosphomutase